jgi:tyrosyl-tRNA synthetase
LNDDKLSFYIGFDPSSDSLHVGHLLQIVTALRLKKAGHSPVILVGGATAQVGDPTGKSKMREPISAETLHLNISEFRRQLISLFPGYVLVEDNAIWYDQIKLLSFLKDIGSMFTIKEMLQADSLKLRLDNDLTFLECNYALMQAYDFLKLHDKYKVHLQIAGDDLWSNMLTGATLVEEKTGQNVLIMSVPLLEDCNGQKMGKTEKETIWLNPAKTTVSDFFKFWYNLSAEEVITYLKKLTFLSLEEISQFDTSTLEGLRSAKEKLAYEVTKFVHGEMSATIALNKFNQECENVQTE